MRELASGRAAYDAEIDDGDVIDLRVAFLSARSDQRGDSPKRESWISILSGSPLVGTRRLVSFFSS